MRGDAWFGVANLIDMAISQQDLVFETTSDSQTLWRAQGAKRALIELRHTLVALSERADEKKEESA